jgi:hypothetical protein
MKRTRLKLTIGLILLIFVEFVLKHFLPGAPFAEAVAAEVAIGGWYLEKKTRDNLAHIKTGA